MPADEVTHGTDVDESRVRTGPRHAAPKRPLFTRFHMPAGKAIASVAMPTAVLVGFGFTSSLAIADTNNTSTSNSQKANEYKDCVTALDSASPSASASDDSTSSATPSATASADATKDSTSSGKSSSSDSGSGDTATPTPSASKSSSTSSSDSSGSSGSSGSDSTATPSPSASASSGGNLLETIGDAITGILSGGTTSSSSDSTASATPSPSASASSKSSSSSSSSSSSTSGKSSSRDAGSSASGTVKDTVSKATKAVTDTVKDTTGTATKAAADATSSASPSPSASSTTSAGNCEAATDDVSGVDNKEAVADNPWYLSASSLTLKSADYQGVVEVKTASGAKKKVLKYVISGGTDIGNLHQTVKDTTIGKTYHVQAASGSTSTITGGATTMYTESISGNLFGLIPITFSPDNPPPLNIPLIYFTNVKVVQAAQFGGTLHVPGMHVYTTDGTS
ncbi:hypothetical protein [Streptomyces sp. NPDC101234]|uniref:hypothetical protein n=1 Tax=Streptomyces sp. NPDC101234 TaxID=3366138 RepID=UPI0038179BB9